MHFSMLTLHLTALITLITLATAVEIRFYHNNYACTGSDYAYWWNIPADVCWKSGPGANAVHAVQFRDVPSGGKGQAYRSIDDCSYYGGHGWSGTYCLTEYFFYNAGWFWASSKLRARQELENLPSSTGYQYSTPDGGARRIACGTEEFETVKKLLAEGDYEALAGYPDDTISQVQLD